MVADVGHEAGAEIVCDSSLKAALDCDWDQVAQREEALELVLHVLQAVEVWMQALEQEERKLAQPAVGYSRTGNDRSRSFEIGNCCAPPRPCP